MINLELVEKRGLSEEDARNILNLQQKRDSLFLKLYYAKDERLLKIIYKAIVANEYKLQKLWGFPEDETFHNLHGAHVPQCSCPTIDNIERVGATKARVVNSDCKIHG